MTVLAVEGVVLLGGDCAPSHLKGPAPEELAAGLIELSWGAGFGVGGCTNFSLA
jgi:hypothetical protein